MRLHDLLVQNALAQGFAQAAGVDIEAAAAEYSQHYARFQSWVAEGNHASMAWLERGLDRRSDLKKVFPSTQSVFCVALPYPVQVPGTSGDQGVRYARYMWGRDYHEEVTERLQTVMSKTEAVFSGLKYKICVDTSAVLERSWAAFAGLGWIGKNTMLIHPKWGSFFLIGVVLLSESLGESLKLLPNYCGNCSACLSGCPTQAFSQPGVLDARKCISAWTLETRGELKLTSEQRQAIQNRVAGCDICQEVCPFNLKAMKQFSAISTHPALEVYRFDELLNETSEQYRARVEHSALNRVKYEDFKRNLDWVLKNRQSRDSSSESSLRSPPLDGKW